MKPFVAIVAAAAFVAACAQHVDPVEAPRPVALAQAASTGGEAAVFAGEVKPRHEADLSFRIGGKLIARAVDAGARVRKGQVLARLDPADTGLQAEAARASVAATQTEYEFARAEFDRYRGLFEKKFISASALDAKKSAMDANRAKYEQARANLAVAQNQAGYATLVAPDDGVITGVNAEAGQVVGAGQPVLRLAREDEREVAIAVPEARVGELSGAKLGVVLVANPRKTYPARVREIAPAVDPVTRTFSVRVSVLDPDPALQWGMTANVVVVAANAVARGTLLPLPALYHTSDSRPAVWIYDANEGKVTLRPVVVAQYREDGVVIGDGVAAGEWVVAAGANKLREGQPVRPYETPGRAVPPPPAAQNAAAPRV